ncbi:hypothetical protein SFRURICE_007456 [Spodoptera frugiperda]|nr:hypothetical protein SFRURICE_007456 [Spodoptera frugiperda]
MLCAAIMTEHWEHVVWEHAALAALANASNTALQWLLDEKVAKFQARLEAHIHEQHSATHDAAIVALLLLRWLETSRVPRQNNT